MKLVKEILIMADKLLVEIELLNDRAEDAVFALVYLANQLAGSPVVQIGDDDHWEEEIYEQYKIKWRFAEDSDRDKKLALLSPGLRRRRRFSY